ncbi:grpE protein homolog, mitochondrial-like [Phlebotomus papatasi]|uniref:grpE protein homolog, mitochondrial-like n=1 Tax=Phlebotomus papatasi TaxID=29031 RepID=UPI00248392D3|nr:grpE protein homolog, mitochondrial-like [Phlebotomus papatasi]
MCSIRVNAALKLLRSVPAMGGQSQIQNFSSPIRFLSISTSRRNIAPEERKDNQVPEVSESEKKLTALLEELNKQLSTEKEKSSELLDKYKRALADGENLRVRLTKQIEDAKQFGIQSFCKDLLEVADILATATDTVPKEEVTDKNPHLKSLYEGLTMTKASLDQVFKRHGLERVNPLNEKFNPNLHEALFQLENKTVEPNTVIEVSKIGYKLKERCIRPALVGVSKSS